MPEYKYDVKDGTDTEKTKDPNFTNGISTIMGPSVIVLPPTKPKEDKKAAAKTCSGSVWKTALLGFTENTTLHGVRFIFMENVFVARRAVWLILFSLCSVLMMVQIVERIVHFYSFPMTVNVQVNYNKTLAFPAITICNQNAFRATAAADKNLYRLLETMHSGQMPIVNSSFLREYGAEKVTLEYLYLATKHLKENLIQACEWQNEVCGPDNFIEILTDHGVCFTFNHDINNPLWATSAGSEYGLRLTLNVEQYEYMPGPHNAAGIKVLLHDHNEFPKVAELGLAVPTGSHTFVGIQMCTIKNLPAPHGSCNSMESPFYRKYTPDACQMACAAILAQKICGCRHFFLPHVANNPPVCTLEQYYDCYTKHIDEIKADVRENCECPVPCTFLIYDPTVSFASTSSYATDGLLGTTNISKLTTEYYNAKETTSRMDQALYKTYQNLESDMRQKFDHLRDILSNDVQQKVEYQKVKLVELHDNLSPVYKNKSHLLLWQEFQVRKNFVRARTAMEERTLSVMAHSYQEFAFKTEGRISQLAAMNGTVPLHSADVRTAILLTLENSIGGRVDLSERALENYTELYNAYETGVQIFGYLFHNMSSVHITPRPLLKYALIHNDLAKAMCGRLSEDIHAYKQALLEYLDIGKSVFENSSLDVGEMHEVNVNFLLAGRRFYHSKSVFYSECVDYPVQFLLDKHDDLNRRWRLFQDRFDSMHSKIDSVLDDLQMMRSTALQTLQHIVDLGKNFTTNRNVTKLDIAKRIISDKTLESTSDLKNFMSRVRLRVQNIYDAWGPLILASNDIWSFVLEDENLYEFCVANNMTEYLRSYDDVSKELAKTYTDVRDECDFTFRHLLETQDSLFLNSLQKMVDHMNEYHASCQLDTHFIQNNFLQLDIFYREKSFEQITQQRAYDMFALLCDIGGSMGLFVGASFLTLYEILDFGVHQCLLGLFRRCIS